MIFTAKGILRAIGDKQTTNNGITVQNFIFEQENGKPIYPSCLGKKVDILENFLPGDEVELSFYISGSKRQYNNVIVETLNRV